MWQVSRLRLFRNCVGFAFAFLQTLATALFVSYAIQEKPLEEWGVGLLRTLELAKQYIERVGRDVQENRPGAILRRSGLSI